MKQEIQGVSILMPCLNEEKTVGICIQKAQEFLQRNKLPGEVLIADNNSTDASAQIAEELGARVILVPEPGYGAALLAGIQEAEHSCIIMGDCDDSYNFLEIKPFYDKIKEGADLVVGNRFLGGIESGAMPFLHRYFGNPFLSGMGRLLYRSPVSDFHCGLRSLRREAVLGLGLCTKQMEFASEMIVKAGLAGLKVEEIPCKLYKDKRGRSSHLRSIRDGLRHFMFLIHPAWFENKKK